MNQKFKKAWIGVGPTPPGFRLKQQTFELLHLRSSLGVLFLEMGGKSNYHKWSSSADEPI